jgi:hypothetical protein
VVDRSRDERARWRAEVASGPVAAAASLAVALDRLGPIRRIVDAATGDGPIASVGAAGLSVDALARGLRQDGALIVRGLVPSERCAALAHRIADACAGRDRFREGAPAGPGARFAPFEPRREMGMPLTFLRHVARMCEAVMVADAPSVLDLLLATVAETGVVSLVAEHLGESPALSVDKTLTRHAPARIAESYLPDHLHPGWHQDGASWDHGTRALDLWIAFDNCGPGTGRRSIELHPRPMREIVPEAFDDPPAHVAALEAIQRSVAPVALALAAGDAVLFDHLNLHRTEGGRSFTEPRASAELWFFAPSVFPAGLTPMAICPA